MLFFRDYFAPVLNNGCVKVLVILIFGLYLLGAGYGITQIEEGLERRKVAKNDSYAIEFFDREDDYYREFPYRVQVIISGEYDYSDPMIQNQVENLTQTFENTSYISNTLYTESWLRSFIQYAERNQDYLNISIANKKDFVKTLKELWLAPSSAFSLDVKFDDTGENIIAMRFLIQAVNISGTEHEKEMVRALRKICKESPLNCTVFHPYFVFFDQFELVRPLSIQNMIIGASIMMLVSFIFIPNILCSFWVALSIISIEAGVVGYMALWGVNLDSISMINLIMCIGFSVDYTAHICYAYMSSKAKTPDEKVKESLYALGLPIFQGSVSTILGMIALLLANNYIFAVFFKMVFLVVFCGAMHGMFLLPVLLSLFGPGSCTRPEIEDDVKLSSIEKSLPHPYCIPHPQFTLNGSTLGGAKGGNLATIERYTKKPYKLFPEAEKDLGLGTSEENSSESSIQSHKKQSGTFDDAALEKRYRDAWRRNSEHAVAYRSPQVLDIFGHEAESEYYRYKQSKDVVDGPRGRMYDSPSRSRYEAAHRRYSPPEARYTSTPNGAYTGNNGHLFRSNSYHNVHPRFYRESKFP
ncbi:unnamed protein product [Callosobruchus maculatus]|nr:unnamed protein product [Callosobruchus maculatus]